MSGPRIATLDIETSPTIRYSWRLYDDNGSIDQIIEDPRILCVGVKWNGRGKPFLRSEWEHGRRGMLEQVAEVIDSADIVQGWNSQGFDFKWIIGELTLEGIDLPSPVRHLDLMKVTKKHMRLPSYKLDYVSQRLGVGGKASTGGFRLWKDVLAGDEKAQVKMGRYCLQDVRITERVGHRLTQLPNALPHAGLYGGEDAPDGVCPRCLVTDVQRRGTVAVGRMSVFQQFRCKNGHWFRGKSALARVDTVGVG